MAPDESKFMVLNTLSNCTSLSSSKIRSTYDEALNHISALLKESQQFQANGQEPKLSKFKKKMEKLKTLKGRTLGYDAKLEKKKLKSQIRKKKQKLKHAVRKSGTAEDKNEECSNIQTASVVKKKKKGNSKKKAELEDRDVGLEEKTEEATADKCSSISVESTIKKKKGKSKKKANIKDRDTGPADNIEKGSAEDGQSMAMNSLIKKKKGKSKKKAKIEEVPEDNIEDGLAGECLNTPTESVIKKKKSKAQKLKFESENMEQLDAGNVSKQMEKLKKIKLKDKLKIEKMRSKQKQYKINNQESQLNLAMNDCTEMSQQPQKEIKETKPEPEKKGQLEVGIAERGSKKKMAKLERLQLKKKMKREKIKAKQRQQKVNDQEAQPNIPLPSSNNETDSKQNHTTTNSTEMLLQFNKFEFNEEKSRRRNPKKDKIIEGKFKCEKDPEKALERIQMFNEKLTELNNAGKQDKAEAVVKKESWKKALLRAEGVKVKDNVALLKKSLKKKERAKNVSSNQWSRRVESVEKKKEERQKKRQENIKKKKDQKKKMKIKKSIKKGRVVL